MGPIKWLFILLVLYLVTRVGDCGKTKKTIKIHVPYYVKHIHHYKKVYVPKIQVIKHEHHHKKEHDHHHHHHHDHHGHDHYHSYDKAGHGYADESSHYDIYYDDIDGRAYGSDKYSTRTGKFSYRESPQYRGWKDADGSEYRSGDSLEDDEEDYSDIRNYSPNNVRVKPKPADIIIPIYRKRVRSSRRSDSVSNDTIIR